MRLRREEIALPVVIILLGALGAFLLLQPEVSPALRRATSVPVSLLSKRVGNYGADPIANSFPAARLDIIADLIRDQEPDADVMARFAVIQANMLTPVVWLVTPTATRTPTPTRLPTNTPTIKPTMTRTPTHTATPTPSDPWIPAGQWTVGCQSEIALPPVSATKWRFQMVSGGGEDNLVSLYCCGSGGVEWLVAQVWQPVTDQSLTLTINETRESVDLHGALATRMRFDVGCNDGEKIDVRLSYLPFLPPSTSPVSTMTVAPTVAPSATPGPVSEGAP